MTEEYEEEHPLHGRDAEWIDNAALRAVRKISERTPHMSAVYDTADLLALVHRYRQQSENWQKSHDVAERRRASFESQVDSMGS